MPTILIDPQDFAELLGSPIDPAQLPDQLDLVKGEFKGLDENGLWRVELNDTNRPDLWSAEGIARQLRSARGRRRDYPFFTGEPVAEIRVEAGMRELRPYVAAFLVRGLKVTERCLVQIIQTQEKLAENFGRRRRDVAIGVYNADKITFPVHYRPVEPHSHSYVPLGFEQALSLAEILDRHPKGVEYRDTLVGQSQVPLLIDRRGMTLSMPPIINSRDVGEVVPGDTDLFVEATGTDLAKVILALNIMACDLADRGGRIERVRTRFAYQTPFGKDVDVPQRLQTSLAIPLSEFGRMLGVPIKAVEVDRVLECYGCDVRLDGETVLVQPAPTRADYLHLVDAVEDFAIARGYQTFEPRMPRDFTAGRSDGPSILEDKVRDVLVGLGYEELISNVLVSRTVLRERMNLGDEPLVEVANVMNENHSALRDAVLPCLLNAESRSSTAAYPHRLFEAGEVAVFDRAAAHGSHTRLRLAALVTHRECTLSEAHADLEALLLALGVEYVLQEAEHPSFLPGRSARIAVGGTPIGWLGEIHPEVLTRWSIGMPVAAFELDLGPLV